MKKKLLASLLALCMVFSLLPVGALAEGDTEVEGEGGGSAALPVISVTTFDQLKTALTSDNVASTIIIKLAQDITVTDELTISRPVTINFDSHKLTANYSSGTAFDNGGDMFYMTAAGKVEMTNGTIETSGVGFTILVSRNASESELVLTDMTISAEKTAVYNRCDATLTNCTVTGGKYIARGDFYPAVVNVTSNVDNAATASMTISGGSYTANESFSAQLISVESKANLTIEDGAHVTNNSGDAVAVLEGGTLTVDGETTAITAKGTAIAGNNTIATENITVNNGTITSTNDIAIYIPAVGVNTFTGGTITGKTGIYMRAGTLNIPADSTVTIEGTGDKADLNSAQKDGTTPTGSALVLESNSAYKDTEGNQTAPVATIAGGTFVSTSNVAVEVAKENDTCVDVSLTITGGTFSSDPTEYLAEGYKVQEKTVEGTTLYEVVQEAGESETYTATFSVKDSEGQAISNPAIVVSYTEGEGDDAQTNTVDAVDGSYTLTRGVTYTYTVTAEGYKEAAGEVTEPDEGTDSTVVEVTMEAVEPPEEVPHTVTLVQPEAGGTLSATVEGKDAGSTVAHGSEVVITAAPAAGYQLKTLTVNGKVKETVAGADGAATYTISFLTEDVTVSAEFEKKTFTITVDEIEGGKEVGEVTLVEPNADKGTAVTFTVKPAAGYKIKDVTAKTADGAAVEVTPGTAAGSYTFTMPAADVTISAVFAKKAAVAGVSVYTSELAEGVNVAAELGKTGAGDPVVTLSGTITREAGSTVGGYYIPLVFTTSEGAALEPVTAILMYKEPAAGSNANGLAPTGISVEVDGVKYEFAVNPSDILVTPVIVKTETAADTEAMTVPTGMTEEQAAEAKAAVEEALQKADAPALASSAEVTDIVAKAADDAKIPEGATDVAVTVSLDIKATEYVPAAEGQTGNPVLRLDIEPKYEVTYTDKDGETQTAGSGTLKSFEKPQTVKVPLPTGFVTDATKNSVVVRHIKTLIPSSVTVDAAGAFSVSFASKSFSPFSIEVNDKSVSVKFGTDAEPEILTLNSVAEAFKLPTATLEGKTFKGWALTADAASAKYTGGVALTESVLEQLIADAKGDTLVLYPVFGSGTTGPTGGGGGGGVSTTVTVPSAAGGKVSVSNSSAKAGDTVTITATPDTGKVVDTVTVTDARGNAVAVTDAGNGRYTFTMPDGKVTVKVTFKDEPADADTDDAPRFADVPADAYYADAVKWAVEKGITLGTSETKFSPDASCTRAQVVTFLWRAAGSPKASGSNSFTDVKSGDYYYDAVLWAVANNITLGTSATAFSPDAVCTRAQIVTFLYRYEGSPAVSGGSSFNDVAATDYYANAVSWAISKGVTVGAGGNNFSPNDTCTRGQTVTFLYRDMAE